jgi:hypothetical protein
MTTFTPSGHTGVRLVRATKTKQPTEVLTFGLDFGEGGQLASGETIDSLSGTVTIDPAAELVNDSSAASGEELQLTFSAGNAGTTYTVTGLALTSAGQKLGFKIIIVVAN